MTRAWTTDRLAGAALALFAIYVLWECRQLPFGTIRDPGAGAVPVLLALTLLACGLAVIGAGGAAQRVTALSWQEWRHGAAILGACAFMAMTLERLGYRLAVFLALLALVALVERKGWIAGGVFAGAFALGSHYLFNTLLRVPLPQGPLGF
jgi:hypothetical protein